MRPFFHLLFLVCLLPVSWVAAAAPLPGKYPAAGDRPGKDSLPADTLLNRLIGGLPLLQKGQRAVQVIYTRVDRGANGIPVLRHHYWKTDSNRYFFPGSAMRLPLALLAVQRLDDWKPLGVELVSTLLTEAERPEQTAVYNDPMAPDGRPTPGQYLKRMLLGDDADAFNRLYEMLGQSAIHRELRAKGYGNTYIVQRQGPLLSEEQNRCTNPFRLLGPGNRELFRQPLQCNTDVYPARRDSLGKAYYSNGKLYPQPLNCSGKNRASLEQLHQMLIGLVFPEKVTSASRFRMGEELRHFLLRTLGEWPAESGMLPFGEDTLQYYPARGRYLLLGGRRGAVPPAIRVLNVSGIGYGAVTDVAYIVDTARGIEFFVSATVDCSRDGVLHPDTYDYETVGKPLLEAIGKKLLEEEAARQKSILPDAAEWRHIFARP